MPGGALTQRLVALALEEDLAGPGDLTSRILPADRNGKASVLAKQELVLSGTDAFREVFRQVDPRVEVSFEGEDGSFFSGGTTVGWVSGSARSILSAERTALNFLQRLSAIATRARAAARLCEGTNARVVDTRKTTPGLRALEKAAVRAGGASNHRFGLFDGVLIKDNHIAAVGSLTEAVHLARRENHHLVRVECECDTLDQVAEALEAGTDVLLLDNMTLDDLRAAVRLVDRRALIEASGGITWDTLADVAATGVDFISMGALTHTVAAADLSLEWHD